MTFEEATMIEPLGCVIAGQHQLDLKEGQSVLVIGSGVSGILHVQLAKLKGARVIVVDINEYKIRKALQFGADAATDANTFSAEKLKSMNEWFKPWYDFVVTAVGNGFHVVEAAGNGYQDLDSAVYSTGNGGHYPFRPENNSGAIIVGAGAVPPSFFGTDSARSRLDFSNYGSRLDLQGWGEFVQRRLRHGQVTPLDARRSCDRQ